MSLYNNTPDDITAIVDQCVRRGVAAFVIPVAVEVPMPPPDGTQDAAPVDGRARQTGKSEMQATIFQEVRAMLDIMRPLFALIGVDITAGPVTEEMVQEAVQRFRENHEQPSLPHVPPPVASKDLLDRVRKAEFRAMEAVHEMEKMMAVRDEVMLAGKTAIDKLKEWHDSFPKEGRDSGFGPREEIGGVMGKLSHALEKLRYVDPMKKVPPAAEEG